ncbi:MAG: hypothetical protein WA347_06320 [Rhabdochlamydiaceae bacterium]
MATEVRIRPVRFDQESIGDKFQQSTLGRNESVAKIVLLAGFAIAQFAKIVVKIVGNILTNGKLGQDYTSFSLKGIARDCVILTAIFQRTFNEGICGVIFSPQADSRSFVETAAEVFDLVYRDSYHFYTPVYRDSYHSHTPVINGNEKRETPISSLIREHIIEAPPSLEELVFDKGSPISKFLNINFQD